MGHPSHLEISQAIIDGDVARSTELARSLVASGTNLLEAIEQGYGVGIRRVGDLWEEGEYFLPELVQGAEAMKAAMQIIQPALAEGTGPGQSKGRVVLGTITGDLHDIGKSLVGTLLAANGFEVFDLGSDVPIASYLDKAREVDAHIVASSALLTTTMAAQKDLAEALAAAGLPRAPRILIGGAPTTPEWAATIGATYAENAMRAVAAAEQLIHG